MERAQRLLCQMRQGFPRLDPPHAIFEREAEGRLLGDQVWSIVRPQIPNEWDLSSCGFSGAMEDVDKILVIIGWSRGVVNAEKIDPAEFRGLESRHDPEKVGIRLDMRRSKPG